LLSPIKSASRQRGRIGPDVGRIVCPDRIVSRHGQDTSAGFIGGEQPRGGVAVAHAKLAAGPIAVGVDGILGHAELAGDLF
jgi:hypothetical protein